VKLAQLDVWTDVSRQEIPAVLSELAAQLVTTVTLQAAAPMVKSATVLLEVVQPPLNLAVATAFPSRGIAAMTAPHALLVKAAALSEVASAAAPLQQMELEAAQPLLQ